MSNNFVCCECGHVFSSPRKITEKHGLDTPPYETYYCCPVCGGAYVETKKCVCCNYDITDRYVLTADGKCYCEDCFMIKNIFEE